MGKYLDKTGLQHFYDKLKEKFADKTYASSTTAGIVKVGGGLNINNGTLSTSDEKINKLSQLQTPLKFNSLFGDSDVSLIKDRLQLYLELSGLDGSTSVEFTVPVRMVRGDGVFNLTCSPNNSITLSGLISTGSDIANMTVSRVKISINLTDNTYEIFEELINDVPVIDLSAKTDFNSSISYGLDISKNLVDRIWKTKKVIVKYPMGNADKSTGNKISKMIWPSGIVSGIIEYHMDMSTYSPESTGTSMYPMLFDGFVIDGDRKNLIMSKIMINTYISASNETYTFSYYPFSFIATFNNKKYISSSQINSIISKSNISIDSGDAILYNSKTYNPCYDLDLITKIKAKSKWPNVNGIDSHMSDAQDFFGLYVNRMRYKPITNTSSSPTLNSVDALVVWYNEDDEEYVIIPISF